MSRKSQCGLAIQMLMLSVLLTNCMGLVQDHRSQSLETPSFLPTPLANKAIRVTDLPAMGDINSMLALVEVTDYQCPFCQAHYREILPLLKREFIDTGRLSYYVLDYPLPGHEDAALAAVAASCAGDQQAYWPFHDALFEQRRFQSERELLSLANDLDLDDKAFEDCFDSRLDGPFLERRRSRALGLGIQGTPTFLLGRLDRGRVVTDIAVLPGLQDIGHFREVIDRYENPVSAGI